MSETKIKDLEFLTMKLLSLGTLHLDEDEDPELQAAAEPGLEVIELIASHIEDAQLRTILEALCRGTLATDYDKLREGACKNSLDEWDNGTVPR